MQSRFRNLLSPGYIGNMEIPNRLVMVPMGARNGTRGGEVSRRTIDYYADKAEGGSGLIVVEATYVDDIASKGSDGCIGAVDNYHALGLEWLATTIHDHYGIKCALQLCHIGKQLSMAGKRASWGPSDMEENWGGIPVHVHGMTKEEIRTLEQAFAHAARRAQMAGFDAVEVHASGGHLYDMYLTPRLNQRTDEYGGSIENRTRIILETIEAIQKRCGADFPILVRLTGWEYEDDLGGQTLEDSIAAAKMLEAAGIAAIDMTAGSLNNGLMVPTMYDKRATHAHVAEAFKKAGVKTPIIIAGGITTPELAEEILAKGQADFIGLGRPILADSHWVRKIEAGAHEDIVPCIRCGMGCIGTMEQWNASKGVHCSVNPRCNLEGSRQVAPLAQKKKIAIVGGGPGGMEAARLATLRGHDVTLYEKRKLGGALHEASWDLDLKSDVQFLVDYYVGQMKKLKVKVVYEEATAETIISGGYDGVIVATGALCKGTKVPGHDKPHVFSPLDVTGGREKDLGQTVIVVGGGVIGAEIAVSQAMKSKKVVLTTRRGARMGNYEIASDDSTANQMRLLAMLREYGVAVKLCLDLKEITDDGIISVDMEGNTCEIKGDSVVVCAGFAADTTLYKALQGKVKKVYAIGDCVKARLVGDAIHEGWTVANQI